MNISPTNIITIMTTLVTIIWGVEAMGFWWFGC